MLSSPAPSSAAAMAGGGLIAVLLVLSACAVCGARADCPAACECKWRSGKESAICAAANMTAVPRHLDYGTQLLDLTDNPLYRLGKDAFADADLLNLQKLYLSQCRIKSLDRYAFRKLNNLVELDLSHNSIPVVPSAVFESVPELRELKLNGNPIMRVPNGAFARVPRLVRLDVSGCRVALLESTAFAGLENSLEWLRLDNNQLREVKPSTVVSLTRLHGVQLHDNPWNCSCKLRPLREWMARRNVPYGAPPVCKTPVRLAQTPWDKLDLDDFACEPHSAPVSAVVVVTEGDNATVSCRMYGVPIPSSRWTRNDRPLAPTGRSVPVTEGRYTNLTIVSAVAQDGGSYACELENRSGSSRSNVTVVVVKRSPDLVLGADRYALPGLIVGVILVLSFCLIFLCGLAIRSKGSPAGSRGIPVSGPLDSAAAADADVDPFDRYEKIEMDREDNDKTVQHHQYRLPASSSSSDKNGRPDPPGYAKSAVTSGTLVRGRHDEHEDYDGLPPIGEPPSSTAPSITDRPTARPSHPTTNVPHRPRILPDDPTDGKQKTYLECNLGEVTLHHHVLHKESLPAGHLYTTAAGRQELFKTKNVPDLLDTLLPTKGRRISQTLPRSGISSNNRRNTMYTQRPSESQSPLLQGSRGSGGSNTSQSQLSFDSSISSDHPRQLTAGQKSSSYLNLSTTGCGGGSSGAYHYQHHPSYYWTPPSLPSSPARERRLPATPIGRNAGLPTVAAETPILDPLSSRRRTYSGGGGSSHHHHNHNGGGGGGNQMHNHNQLAGSNHSLLSLSDGASVTYDYHTAQLDMFLDEYKTLRKELTKMQRTCDTLRLSNASLASSVAVPDMVDHHRSKPEPTATPATSSSLRTTPKSILKNKNQATYVYRPGGERRNSYHKLDPAPDDIYLS
ncbi:unnamed protein product [Aphis gossypii]|uniref:Ig-like domain-containing protein n=1 Tax=Aphis gossypii TaxID=80765 RepID=A0A9P0JF45_APHGO|nr:unnamed protein product [Aphis gossypii]